MITAEQRLKVQKILASNSLTRTELANYRDRILNMIEVADPHRAELMRAFDNASAFTVLPSAMATVVISTGRMRFQKSCTTASQIF